MPTKFRRRRRSTLLVCAGTIGLAAAALVGCSSAKSPNSGEPLPCNIYASAGAPCVAAYSTVRALYEGYHGPLYQVQRSSDGGKLNIGVLATHDSSGPVANAAAQDAFCAHTSCTITKIYDQSPQHNDLDIAQPRLPHVRLRGAPADALPIRIDGHKAYGIKISPGMGYRDNRTTHIAVNGGQESIYMVTSAEFTNTGCCFDFGNAEPTRSDNGNGHMDALEFSTRCGVFPPCNGAGPWVQADLENGLFKSDSGGSKDPADTGFRFRFVTAMTKTNGQNFFALKGANAQKGGLTTTWSGPLPTFERGYSPLQEEGGIVLGIAGDNTHDGQGEFFEGVITDGMPSNSTDNRVQASIVSAGYGR